MGGLRDMRAIWVRCLAPSVMTAGQDVGNLALKELPTEFCLVLVQDWK